MRDESRVKTIAAAISAIISIFGVVISLVMGAKLTSISIGPISFGSPTPTIIPILTPTTTPTPISVPTDTPMRTPKPTPTSTLIPPPTATAVPSDLQAQVAMLQHEVAALRQELDSLTQVVASNPNPDSIALRADLQSLDQRLSVIEQAVLDNPARALQLTLLSREMDNLKANYQSDLESTRQEIGRIYDLNKWFIGLMFTMAIGLLSLAVSNFIKKPERQEERKEQQEEPKRRQSASARR